MSKQSEFIEKLLITWAMLVIAGVLVLFLTVITMAKPALGIAIILTLLSSALAVAVHVWSKP